MLKHPKANRIGARNIDFIFLRKLIRLACYCKIVWKLLSYTSIMTISKLDFNKIWFLIVGLQIFELVIIDILVKLRDSSISIKHKNLL